MSSIAGLCDWIHSLLFGWMWRFEWPFRIDRKIDSVYYTVRSWFFPWNRMRIRNMPRTYMEPGAQMPHAMFSLLCRFVENSRGDMDAFVKWSQLEGNACLREMLDLYHWYTSVNWEDPVGWPGDRADHDAKMAWAEKSNEFESVTVPAKCKQLVDLMGAMWS